MNRHPVILARLGELLPPPNTDSLRRPETRLRADLRIPAMQHVALSAMQTPAALFVDTATA